MRPSETFAASLTDFTRRLSITSPTLVAAFTVSIAEILAPASGQAASVFVAQDQKDKSAEVKKPQTLAQKFETYRNTVNPTLAEKLEAEILREGVPGIALFLNGFLSPAERQTNQFSLRCRNIVVREASAGGKGNPEVIAMVVDRLANPGYPSMSSLEEILAMIGTPAIDRVYAVFDKSAWKDAPKAPDAEISRRKASAQNAVGVLRTMLGEDEKHISDDVLLPRLHGTLTASDKEGVADDDVRATSAALLMRRSSGMPWLQKALTDEKTARHILIGLEHEMQMAKKGEFFTISDSGLAAAKRYRSVIEGVMRTHSSLKSDGERVFDLFVAEERARTRRLEEATGKKKEPTP